jgi:hypothetical protein
MFDWCYGSRVYLVVLMVDICYISNCNYCVVWLCRIFYFCYHGYDYFHFYLEWWHTSEYYHCYDRLISGWSLIYWYFYLWWDLFDWYHSVIFRYYFFLDFRVRWVDHLAIFMIVLFLCGRRRVSLVVGDYLVRVGLIFIIFFSFRWHWYSFIHLQFFIWDFGNRHLCNYHSYFNII